MASVVASFAASRPELVREHPGRYALVCGPRLLGVHGSVEEALRAAAEAFDDGTLEEGAPIQVHELREEAPLFIAAEPRPGV